jgi:hypothetical protein
MNILIITPYLPYPPDSGGRAAQFSMLKAYPENYRIRLVYKVQAKADIENARILEGLLENLTIILCGESREDSQLNEPLPKKGLAKKLLRFPARVAWKLLLIYESLINSTNPKPRSSRIDKAAQTDQVHLPFPAYNELSEPVLKAIQSNLEWADLVQADFIELITLGSLPLNTKPKVFVAHQVHNSYVDTFFESIPTKAEERIVVAYHSQLTRLIERTFLQEYNGIIVFSKEDHDELKRIGVDKPILVSPYTYPLDINPVDPNSLNNQDWKKELVFIGSGDHGPNEEGLEWFLRKVYPNLSETQQEGPRPPLFVVGKWSSKQQQNFQEDQVKFVGYADDLSEAIKGRICICPIRIGAGLRTKLLAAAICSSPIVTTTLGCQGIGMEHEVHCLIADSASEFAAQLLRLMNNISSMAPMLAANANQLVKSHFSQEVVSKDRISFYESLANKKIYP